MENFDPSGINFVKKTFNISVIKLWQINEARMALDQATSVEELKVAHQYLRILRGLAGDDNELITKWVGLKKKHEAKEKKLTPKDKNTKAFTNYQDYLNELWMVLNNRLRRTGIDTVEDTSAEA